MTSELKVTALHQQHVLAGAKLVPFHGWKMPLHYGSQLNEHHKVRQACGLFDVSHMQVVDIDSRQDNGLQATQFLNAVLTNDVKQLHEDGQAHYSLMLNEQGGILDDLIVYRHSDGYRLVLNCGCAEQDVAWLRQHLLVGVNLQVRDDLSILALQGPQTFTYLSALFGTDSSGTEVIEKLKKLHNFSSVYLDQAWVQGKEIYGLHIAKTGYTGELGFEFILPASAAILVWQHLIQAGVAPIGLGARDTLRLEAGLNLYGQDMQEEFTPFASNVGWTVKLAKRDFIGKSALLAEREIGVTHQLLGVQLQGKGVLRPGMKLHQQGIEVGDITSGSFSPTSGQSIGLARLTCKALTQQQLITVMIRGQLLPVDLVQPPFVRQGRWCAKPYVHA